jgi:hypothetical protein
MDSMAVSAVNAASLNQLRCRDRGSAVGFHFFAPIHPQIDLFDRFQLSPMTNYPNYHSDRTSPGLRSYEGRQADRSRKIVCLLAIL